jgi:hypothetical protein
MFYRELVALDARQHLGMGVRAEKNYRAAQEANAVPLGISEFFAAARFYPIVFGPAGATGFPIVITALVEGRNLFVNASGHWRDGAYIPNWLQRYPFWMQPDASGQSASLWFDPQAGCVVPLHEDATARPLFDFQGQANQALLQIMQFCRQCQDDTVRTGHFMRALEQERILVARQASIELSPGQNYTLGGFRMIDMQAYHQLPDATLAQWTRNGWAGLVALHQLSMQHAWGRLLDLHHAPGTDGATQP